LTFGVVIFSILVQGLTIKPLVRMLKLANGDDAKAA
jgi:NhaP-type Na+/H+ or K+/H+ antiporter